ncbi:unnamed protein product [Leptidea sinapis]|uniref:DUF4794 domain-containing protein n=1 Tax=Leptidea sinapis TaxID=189913 RepID=A0A5E4QM98_9NEOP|nr:unnamed protein product [Leptidea sinapis]
MFILKVTIFFALATLSPAAYMSRMSPISRFRSPSVFRPGVILNRPMLPMRLIAASHRPYIVYRNAPFRYAMKNISPLPTRSVFGMPWKTTARLPVPLAVTPDYNYLRTASAAPVIHTDGAIHTIPAPNLSLSEKPIVVAETGDNDPNIQQSGTFTLPQQQNLPGIGEGIVIPPNALYNPDPMYISKLQNQFIQSYPAVEFIPYNPDVQTQISQQAQATQPNVYLLQNEQFVKQQPIAFTSDDHMKNIVQRQTQEGSIQSILPHAFTVPNITENLIEVTTAAIAESSNSNTIPTDIQTEISNIEMADETKSENNRTNFVQLNFDNNDDYLNQSIPIYYAQIGQSVGDVIANGFYSSINDVRAASEPQIHNDLERQSNITRVIHENTTAANSKQSKESSEVVSRNDKSNERHKRNSTADDYKNLIASPFEKPSESVNIAYTLYRAPTEELKDDKNRSVFAGQLVEASISEDKEFHKERETRSRQPYLRLFSLTDDNSADSLGNGTVVKAKIPPQSTLTFDANTGEPVLRIYASYVDNPPQKEVITSKLASMKYSKESQARKQTPIGNINAATVNALAGDSTQFGLKLKNKNQLIPLEDDTQ